MREICERTNMGETFIRAEIAKGRFPPGFKLGERARGWLSSDIDNWIADRAAKRVIFKP
jgi:prophage regulatory protein